MISFGEFTGMIVEIQDGTEKKVYTPSDTYVYLHKQTDNNDIQKVSEEYEQSEIKPVLEFLLPKVFNNNINLKIGQI